jgi:hypothetical protein
MPIGNQGRVDEIAWHAGLASAAMHPLAAAAGRSVVKFEPFKSAFRALRRTDSQTFSLD